MDRIFNGYKVKYTFLNSNILPSRASRYIKSINIFINLDDFYHKLHAPYIDREFQATGKSMSYNMVSNLMNLIGHYKNWAVKEHLSPTVYLIYTDSMTFRNSLVNSEYRNYYKHIFDINNPDFYFVNSAISNAHSILHVIAKYVPNVYVINSSYIEPSIVPFFISKVYQKDLNLIVSRDIYDLQYLKFDKWAIFMPKGDNSLYLNKGNLWNYLSYKKKITDKIPNYEPYLLTMIEALFGDKYRSIPKIIGRISWNTLLKNIKEKSDEFPTDYLLSYIISKNLYSNYQDNLKCTDIEIGENSMIDIDRSLLLQQITDMQDPIALQKMNNNIFKTCPINLPFLLRETSTNKDIHDDYFWRK